MDELKDKLSAEFSVTKKVDEDWLKMSACVKGDTPEEFDKNLKAFTERLGILRDTSLSLFMAFPNTAQGLPVYDPIAGEEREKLEQTINTIIELRKNASSSLLDTEGKKAVRLFEKKIAAKKISLQEAEEYVRILKEIQKDMPLE